VNRHSLYPQSCAAETFCNAPSGRRTNTSLCQVVLTTNLPSGPDGHSAKPRASGPTNRLNECQSGSVHDSRHRGQESPRLCPDGMLHFVGYCLESTRGYIDPFPAHHIPSCYSPSIHQSFPSRLSGFRLVVQNEAHSSCIYILVFPGLCQLSSWDFFLAPGSQTRRHGSCQHLRLHGDEGPAPMAHPCWKQFHVQHGQQPVSY
jgi:hypothetical protein